MTGKLISRILNSDNKVVRAAVTKSFPTLFARMFYANAKGQIDLPKGKGAVFSLSFDCDYGEDVKLMPQLLDMLDGAGIKASFACVGKWIEKYPEDHRELVRRGHEIVNHTYSHPDNEELKNTEHFNRLSAQEQENEIVKCHDICEKVLKTKPTGFRIPHFGPQYTTSVYPILKKHGYLYSSSLVASRSKSFGMPFVADGGVVELPVSLCPKHPFGVFDTWHAYRAPKAWWRTDHKKPGEFYKTFLELMGIALRNGLYINLYFDPQDVARNDDFDKILAYLSENRSNLEIATMGKVAKRFHGKK